MADAKLDYDACVRESRHLQGALGAIAYGVLRGLVAGGATPEVVGGVRVVLHEYLQRLSDENCNVLCDVVFARLNEEKERGGRWYENPTDGARP